MLHMLRLNITEALQCHEIAGHVRMLVPIIKDRKIITFFDTHNGCDYACAS